MTGVTGFSPTGRVVTRSGMGASRGLCYRLGSALQERNCAQLYIASKLLCIANCKLCYNCTLLWCCSLQMLGCSSHRIASHGTDSASQLWATDWAAVLPQHSASVSSFVLQPVTDCSCTCTLYWESLHILLWETIHTSFNLIGCEICRALI